MGWNSWDAYGFTIDEADFKANTTVLAGMKRYGWQYAVIDEGWYMANTVGKTLAERQYIWDGNGLLIPDPAAFPTPAMARASSRSPTGFMRRGSSSVSTLCVEFLAKW